MIEVKTKPIHEMSLVATIHIPAWEEGDFGKEIVMAQGEILCIVRCDDGDVYIIRLPDNYWRRD